MLYLEKFRRCSLRKKRTDWDIDRKPPNDMSSEEAKEPKTLDYEQDVLSTWL